MMKSYNNNSKLSLRSILHYLITIAFFVYLSFSKNYISFFNFSIFLLFCQLFLFIHLSKYFSVVLSAILILYTLTFTLPFFLRVLTLSFIPVGFGGIIDSEILVPSLNQISVAIIYLLFINFIFFLILSLFDKFYKNVHDRFKYFANYLFSKKYLIERILILITSIHIFCSIYFGWKMGSESWKFGFISKMLPITFFFNLFIIMVISNWDSYYKYKFKKVIFIILIIVLNSILLGSRSGFYFIILNFIFTFLLLNKNLNFPLIKLILLSPFVILFGLLFFLYATNLRSGNIFSVNFQNLGLITLDALNRLSSSTDSFIAIVNDYNGCLSNNELRDVSSINNLFMQFMNSLVPGKIFSISEFYTPATYFRTHVLGVVNDNYNGDVYSGFGWYYIKFGNFVFLIFAIYISFYLFIILILSKLRGLFFGFCLYFINWFTIDFFLHGSFLLSGLSGLITFTLFVFVTFLFFRLYAD